MPHKHFNLAEVAQYLHVSEENVEKLIREESIPCEKKGDRYIFRRREIDAWASQRILGLSEPRLEDYHKTSSAKYHDLSATHAIIPELMKSAYIRADLASKTKSSVLRDMVGLADETGLLIHKDDLLESLEAREELCSTALGGGLALLHPAHHDPYVFEDSFICLGRTVQDLPFASPDGRTTDLFFLACCQDDSIHLHVLARLCIMFYHTNALLELREAQGSEELYEVLVRAEEEVIKNL